MIEVLNISPIQKGSLLAKCDVRIIPWQITLHEVKIFEKGANRWISLPAREFVNDAGEKKYAEMVTFDNEGVKTRFKGQIMGAVDKFLEGNPEMTPEPVIKDDEDFPF